MLGRRYSKMAKSPKGASNATLQRPLLLCRAPIASMHNYCTTYVYQRRKQPASAGSPSCETRKLERPPLPSPLPALPSPLVCAIARPRSASFPPPLPCLSLPLASHPSLSRSLLRAVSCVCPVRRAPISWLIRVLELEVPIPFQGPERTPGGEE